MNNTPFGFDAPEHSPGFLLWQTTITWQRLIKKALEKDNLSHAQFVIMALLLWFDQKADITQIDLAKLSKLDKMTISKSLKKPTQYELVERREHKIDTRTKNVYLTSVSKQLTRKLVPLIEKIDARFFGQIPPQDQHALIKTLQKLAAPQS